MQRIVCSGCNLRLNGQTVSNHTNVANSVLSIGLGRTWRKRLTGYILVQSAIYSGTHSQFLLMTVTAWLLIMRLTWFTHYYICLPTTWVLHLYFAQYIYLLQNKKDHTVLLRILRPCTGLRHSTGSSIRVFLQYCELPSLIQMNQVYGDEVVSIFTTTYIYYVLMYSNF